MCRAGPWSIGSSSAISPSPKGSYIPLSYHCPMKRFSSTRQKAAPLPKDIGDRSPWSTVGQKGTSCSRWHGRTPEFAVHENPCRWLIRASASPSSCGCRASPMSSTCPTSASSRRASTSAASETLGSSFVCFNVHVVRSNIPSGRCIQSRWSVKEAPFLPSPERCADSICSLNYTNLHAQTIPLYPAGGVLAADGRFWTDYP